MKASFGIGSDMALGLFILRMERFILESLRMVKVKEMELFFPCKLKSSLILVFLHFISSKLLFYRFQILPSID